MRLRGCDLYLLDNPAATLEALARKDERFTEYLGFAIEIRHRTCYSRFRVAMSDVSYATAEEALAAIGTLYVKEQWRFVTMLLLRGLDQPARDAALADIAEEFGPLVTQAIQAHLR